MISSLVMVLSILLIIGFSTLFERKLLSFSQSRKGPEMVGPIGFLQPVADGIKLFLKSEVLWANKLPMLILPMVMLSSMFLFWMPLTSSMVHMDLGCLYLLSVGSLSGLCVLFAGWFGGSSYSYMGGLRAAAQMISYEVVLSFFFMLFCSTTWTLNLFALKFHYSVMVVALPTLFSLWLVLILAETNRAPFDISEGESELVSGFNTEYSSLLFTMMFLAEYGMISSYSVLTSYFFFSVWYNGPFILFLLLWVRSCFPRKRYDYLMLLLWVYIFPIIVMTLIIWIYSLIS